MKYIITEQQQLKLLDDFLEKYIDSGCVRLKFEGNYLLIDVESPTHFESNGFDRSDAARVKNFLKKNSFQYAFGYYIKKIN